MTTACLIFPHQLVENIEIDSKETIIYLIEEYLFFKQYNFHKQKIAFHRASMKSYESYLIQKGYQIVYVNACEEISDIRLLLKYLAHHGISSIFYMDTVDNYLEKRIAKGIQKYHLTVSKRINPSFINSENDIIDYFSTRKKYFQTDFYKHQRLKHQILVNKDGKPEGGNWTYDVENRKAYPKGKPTPKIIFSNSNSFHEESWTYVETYFNNNYGTLNKNFQLPINFDESKKWLHKFFESRFYDFGQYEDAILKDENILHHSLLSPMMNVSLITPNVIVNEALKFGEQNSIPLNSLEGFIRQIIGWREFIAAMYRLKGVEQRTKNYWNFSRKIPQSFWEGSTGIEPIDSTIQKILSTGYCHHIERLMVLGNFMVLCEFHPDDVYQWFMEMFIDSYDWVMVPNVYGMSQFADGGIFATKPYISGSNYILKMSDYKKGDWTKIWDALFWRFMDKHRDFFLSNPRLSMLVRTYDKMDDIKKAGIHLEAEKFLGNLEKTL